MVWLGIAGYLLLIFSAWYFRQALFAMAREELALIAALAGGLFLFFVLIPLIEYGQIRSTGRVWRRRLSRNQVLPSEQMHKVSLRQPVEKLAERLLRPVTTTRLGILFFNIWRDAGFGTQAIYPLFALGLVLFLGYVVGYALTRRVLLGWFASFLCVVAFFVWILWRARTQRRRFGDQFPDVLDRLADSLQAGFSLPQAIDFVIPNFPNPSALEMSQVSGQISLGFSVDEALGELYLRRPSEDVRLLVEGLMLQRQVGGNMAAMMRDMAAFVRSRVDLENEVRTLTTQGRLSAIVIALLVPISIGILSMFPGYIDVLFQTTAGNLVLIVSGVMELIGAAIVSRLIRIEF